jgi:hypothetical protein
MRLRHLVFDDPLAIGGNHGDSNEGSHCLGRACLHGCHSFAGHVAHSREVILCKRERACGGYQERQLDPLFVGAVGEGLMRVATVQRVVASGGAQC